MDAEAWDLLEYSLAIIDDDGDPEDVELAMENLYDVVPFSEACMFALAGKQLFEAVLTLQGAQRLGLDTTNATATLDAAMAEWSDLEGQG